MNRRLGGDASLNAPLRDGGEGEWQDWLVDESADQETLLADREESDARMDALRSALTVLNPRERRIFEARRLADEPITLEELSAEFGVSRERVRQIEVRAFEKVQEAVKAGVAKAQRRKIARRPHCRLGEERGWRAAPAVAGAENLSRGGEEFEIGWRKLGLILAEPKRPPNASHPIPPEPIASSPCARVAGRGGAMRVSRACRRQARHARGRGCAESLDRQIFACGAGRRVSARDGDAGGLRLSHLGRPERAQRAPQGDGRFLRSGDAIVYKAIEQDDGNWRVIMDSLPRIVFHSKEANGSVELTNFRSTALIGPAIAWLLSGSASVDKGTLQIQTPKLDQSIDFGPVQETVTTNVGGDGSVSTVVKEDISEIGLKASRGRRELTPRSTSAAGRTRR